MTKNTQNTKEVLMSGDLKPTKVGTYRRDNPGTVNDSYSYWNGEYWCMFTGDQHEASWPENTDGPSKEQNWDWYDVQPEFKTMKFRTPTPEISEAVQKWLFQQGYVWNGVARVGILNPTRPYLYSNDEGKITWASDAEYFEGHQNQEMKVVPITTYEFVPAEIETVEFDGKKYDKKKLAEALALLKPVE